MEKLKEILDWFITEWLVVFMFGAFFSLVFGDIKLMGWFVIGNIIARSWNTD